MEDNEVVLTQEQAFNKAQGILSDMKSNIADNGKTKSHALLLVYDPAREAFQMVAINSDAEEITALVLSCLATLKESLISATEDRTIN